MKGTGLKRDERWAVIAVGTRLDIYAPPERYPEQTTIPQVLRQPFVDRIRRFVRKRPQGGWWVGVHHQPKCDAVLCVCNPTLHYEKVT